MISTNIQLVPADAHPDYMSQAVQPFTANDFDAAQLNANTRSNFDTVQSAEEKLASLSKFAYRHAVLFGGEAAGSATLMDQNATRVQRVLRHFGNDFSRVRTFNGWYDLSAATVGDSEEDLSTAILGNILDIAADKGLTHVETVVSEEKEGKNPNLIVIEHTARLDQLGFVRVVKDPENPEEQEGEPVRDQGRVYPGIRYSVSL